MNINRHNYEEYFILYLDNELAAEERRELEAFVQMHPDLKEELDFLLQAKFVPDEQIVFEGKEELLFGQQPGLINLSNYEEWFVLYIDNELSNEQKITLEKFLAQHPELNEELAVYQRTRLTAELISFPDKASLYRREEKSRRIIIWRLAAAAVLLIAAAYTTINLLNNKGAAIEEPSEMAVTSTPTQSTASTRQDTRNPTTEIPASTASPEKKPVKTDLALVTNEQKDKRRQNLAETVKKETAEYAVNESPKKLTNNLPEAPQDLASIDHASSLESPVSSPSKKDLTNSTETAGLTPVTKDIIQAYYPTQPIDEMENDGKKSKLRGFLRKVTRTFEKRTNINATDEDDRLLVGGLAIRL